MTNPVRIGKVKFKSGGELRLLNLPERTDLMRVPEYMAERINEDTKAVVFIALQKDGTISPNISYGVGFTAVDLFGMLEQAKIELLKMVWPPKPQ